MCIRILLRNKDQTQSNKVLPQLRIEFEVNTQISWINLNLKISSHPKTIGKLKRDKNAYFSYKVSLMSKGCMNFRRIVQRSQSLP